MKKNECIVSVVGTWNLYPSHMRPGLPKNRWQTISSRPNWSQSRPISKAIVMHYQWMMSIKRHIIEDRCPRCQPGRIMSAFVARAKANGSVNEDVVNLARWVAKARPTKATRRAYLYLKEAREAQLAAQDERFRAMMVSLREKLPPMPAPEETSLLRRTAG